MPLKYKWGLILLLLIPCIGIGLKYEVDLVSYFFTARFAHYDITRVYGLNWDLGPYFYGPVLLPFLEPFGKMDYRIFKAISMTVDTIWYLTIWFCLHELFPILKQKGTSLGWLVVFVLAINPIHQHFQSHQVQIFLAGVVFLSEYLRTRKNPSDFWSGFLIAFAAMTKLFPGLIALYYLFIGTRKMWRGVFAGVVFSIILPIAYFGWTDGLYLFEKFVTGLFGYQSLARGGNDLIKAREILNIPALTARILVAHPTLASLATKIFSGLLLFTFLGSALFSRKAIQTSQRLSTYYWALGVAMSILVFPGTRISYFVFLLPLYALLVELYKTSNIAAARNLLLIVGGFGTWALAFTTDFVIGNYWNNQMESWSVPTWGAIVWLVTLLFFVLQRRPARLSFT